MRVLSQTNPALHTTVISRRVRRAARGSVAAAAFVAITLSATLWVATPAMAHNYYIDSTPGINEEITTLPEKFVVTTNDNLLNLEGAVGGFFMKVTGPDGLYYGDGCVTVNGPSVSMPASLGPSGDYTLDWQVVSADGHTISDTIPFTWTPAEGNESTVQGSTTVPDCSPEAVTAPEEPAESSDAVTTPEKSMESTDDAESMNGLWIGGAVLAVAIAILTTLMLIRNRNKGDSPTSSDEASKE